MTVPIIVLHIYILYYSPLLINTFRVEGGWQSEGMAVFGYSFWLTVLASLGFIANICITAAATASPTTNRKVRTAHKVIV